MSQPTIKPQKASAPGTESGTGRARCFPDFGGCSTTRPWRWFHPGGGLEIADFSLIDGGWVIKIQTALGAIADITQVRENHMLSAIKGQSIKGFF